MNRLRVAWVATLLFCAATAEAVDLWGTVVWHSGTPAAGIELRLSQGEHATPERIFTNSAGRYGLYRLSAPTTNYTLYVLRGGKTVKVVKLPALKNGDRIPNVVMP